MSKMVDPWHLSPEQQEARLWEDVCDSMVITEMEDVLTRKQDGEDPGEHYGKSFTRKLNAMVEARGVRDTLTAITVVMAALSAEAIIRLAATRDEDPRKTLTWIRTTRWTGYPKEENS
jgi:hypothetical protein